MDLKYVIAVNYLKVHGWKRDGSIVTKTYPNNVRKFYKPHESLTQFSYIDKNGNMNNITNKCPIELVKSMKKLFGDNMFDETLVNKKTEDIYDYIIEKIYKTPEYLEQVQFNDETKLKIAFNKFFYRMIK